MREVGAFTQYAERLAENGFTVTATDGKKPIIPNWDNPSPTDLVWLKRMLGKGRYAGYNIGIVCGRVVAIDIDADDRKKLGEFEALAAESLGPTQFKRVGRPGRSLLLYRPAEGEIIDSIRFGCIEVLSGGRQFVAYGIHPDTGQQYEWTSSRHTPATAKLDEMPVITAASVQAFADAVCTALRRPLRRVSAQAAEKVLKARERVRQGEMLASRYDAQIFPDADGRVIDGREAYMAKLTAAEFAKRTHSSPEEVANRVWGHFIAGADLSRPKGSNSRKRWELKDAQAKARDICRRNPDLKRPRRAWGGHPTSHLHALRRPRFWTTAQREAHLVEVGRCICTPATLAIARVMIDAVDLASGFCTASITEIAKRAYCSPKSVKIARAMLRDSGLWIAGPGGVFVPNGGVLNLNQATDKPRRKQAGGTGKVPPLYRLVVSGPTSPPSQPASTAIIASRSAYQPDLFGAAVVDLDQCRRGLLPPDVAASVRAEMRARGVTQDELAAEVGISQPQLANALAGRFGLSHRTAARLLAWLREAA
jgi:hypothetical protein